MKLPSGPSTAIIQAVQIRTWSLSIFPLTPSPSSNLVQSHSIGRAIKDHLILLFGMLGVMWGVEIVDLLPFVHLDRYGIQPRTASGLLGVFTAPFLHVDFKHLVLNSVPFIVLGGTVLLSGVRAFWIVTVYATVVGGAGVWLFGPSLTNHVGASGLIFGYLGFLLARGVFERSFSSIAIAVVILIAYGGLIMGVLPGEEGVSWQGHLFGFLAGVTAAKLMASGN